MIVSGQLGREIIPSIHELQQVISIYVYCIDKKGHEQWARNFAKVKAIIVDLNELISRIETDHRMQKTIEEPLSINIFTTNSKAGTSTMGTSTIGVNGRIHRSGDSQVWIIRMVLCSDNEHELKHVLMVMKRQFGSGKTDLRTLGRLLSEMNKPDLAEKYFIRLLEQLPPNDPLLDDLYQDLAKFASQAGNLDKSMEWRKKAIALQQQNELAGKQFYY
ncbi:unnamed protein product [Rotaria sp. Silwood1]|nr:unnamed protein product [Rotaria sp. Silwood1]